MQEEIQVGAKLDRQLINHVTSIMPTFEGLFLLTVLDGREGLVTFRYHSSVEGEMDIFFADLIRRYGSEICIFDKSVPIRLTQSL